MLWFTSGNYQTLAARQHKHFFCNVYFIKTIFFYGCYGPFWVKHIQWLQVPLNSLMHYKQSTICRYSPHFHHFYAWWDSNSKFLLILCIYFLVVLWPFQHVFVPLKVALIFLHPLWIIDYFIKKMLIAYSWRLDWMPPFSSYSSFPLLAPIPICKWKSKKSWALLSFIHSLYIQPHSNSSPWLHQRCQHMKSETIYKDKMSCHMLSSDQIHLFDKNSIHLPFPLHIGLVEECNSKNII